MRLVPLFLAFLLFGCISGEQRAEENITGNETVANQTQEFQPPSIQWARYNSSYFSFEYPAYMEARGGAVDFIATKEVDGRETETIIVAYLNTTAVYGKNRDKILKENPSQAASELLYDDMEDDFAVILSDADEIGNATTYAIARDGYVAEVPFTYTQDSSVYTGYALNVFIPERSVDAKIRIYTLDPDKARAMRDQFLLSFRIE